MNQIRFQVGVPRAGDAARVSEQEPRARSLSSLAGSAARAAEEAKRSGETAGFQGARTISMRATGGKMFQPEAAAAVSPVRVPPTAVATQSSTGPVLPGVQLSAMTPAEESSQPGVLQTAVSRVQSLVRSLLPGDRSAQK